MPEETGVTSDDLTAMKERLEKQRREQLAEAERIQQERDNLLSLSSRQTSHPARTSDSHGDGGRTFVNFKVIQPPTLDECSSYDMFKKKLELWELSSELPGKEMASLVIASLTNVSKYPRERRGWVLSALSKLLALHFCKEEVSRTS